MATTVLQVRVDEELKNEAAELFENLGIDIPTAIRIFFKRAVAEKGIPFELREPTAVYDANPGWKAFMDLRRQAQRGPAAGMSEAEINAEIAADGVETPLSPARRPERAEMVGCETDDCPPASS